jgi:hypothetical protein
MDRTFGPSREEWVGGQNAKSLEGIEARRAPSSIDRNESSARSIARVKF